MKVYAFYLPQFHRVKENDEWWGEGFTDWVTAKQAEPLFEGHYQPHIPLRNHYYDLSDKSTMQWQADIMKLYGIDGVCIYHYWFKDGRQILEKPAENLLKWTDIDMPFCFYWANAPWARSWSKIHGANVWSDVMESGKQREGNGLLLEQAYGEEEQWEEHFEYMLPFFQDSRYIRIDNKPLFMITENIPCLKEMVMYWRRAAVENGLDGLYIIGGFLNSGVDCLDAVIYHEPGRGSRNYIESQIQNDVRTINYDDIWNTILSTVSTSLLKTYYGGFVGYDDTPRRGKNGMIVTDTTPDKFYYYLTELMAKNAVNGNEVVFINAWNEWGEGMHLEPDERYGMGFLQAIPKAKKNYKELLEKYRTKNQMNRDDIRCLQQRSDKYEMYLNLMDDWMALREKGVRLDKYLLDRGYTKIGLYGYGILGRHFIEEMKESKAQVLFLIDQQRDKLYAPLPVYMPSEKFPDCDVIVVSSVFFMEDICQELKQYGQHKLLSLEIIISEMTIASMQ